MKNHARVVVIGGGIAGCSTLYHLTKLGWSDVVLVEKNELTSGSTWLAAGNVPQYHRSFNSTKINDYAVKLYPTLEEETGQAVDWHTTGSLRIALNDDRLREFKHVAGKDKILGVESHIVTPEDMKGIYPLINTDGIVGGLFHPQDGHVDPASVTQAMAKGARQRGAEIYTHNPVINITQTPSEEWVVHTQKGDITCEIIVNAAGLWTSSIGAMVGLYLPVIAIEHQHILFEDLPELVETGMQLPLLRDPDTSFYMRQESKGLLIGPYENTPQSWYPDGVPMDYASETLKPVIERIQDILMRAINRVPAMNECGVKEEINGPITYTPDGGPLLGPAFGLHNFYLNGGHCFGITQCAAYGLHTAEWIIEGEPSIDLSSADARRYGDYANRYWAHEKIMETYKMMYAIEYPDEIRPAARKAKTSPIYDTLKAKGACFSQTYGWERASWFAPKEMKPVDENSFKRTNWHEPVGAECRAVRERVGVLDLSGFAKFEVFGCGAESFLNYICANKVPVKSGKIAVSCMLNHKGNIKCDVTITKIAKDRFLIIAAAAAEKHDLDWMIKLMPKDGSVTIKNMTYRYGTLVIAGPKSRHVLTKLTDTNLTSKSFPFASMQNIFVNLSPVTAIRIGFTGELGWELYHPIEQQREIYDALMQAGEEYGIVDFGLRAMMSLRLEKGYCILGGEMSSERTPLEAGLERFVNFNKGNFLGRQALIQQKKEGLAETLVLMTVETDDADTIGDEPVYMEDEIVGRVTSGGYGHAVEKSLAMAYVKSELAKPGTRVEISILGKRCPAQVVPISYYDPENKRLKG
ncbi:MAG: FAD-dependent oxidoreductase [Deltaproteobacteria bacterium]|jgi:dimethylglycine dehydrogenase|nr:FAD-dependent oxidoreductase [Deltaproteobacteria bacterium]